MKREELIEEAAKAMYFEDCGAAALGDDAEPFRDMARVALAVFEKAHAPTDTTIPRYAMLDLHAALYGADADFDAFYQKHGYAEAWSRLLGAARARRAAPTDDEREAQGWREAELYASADGDARDDFMTGWRTADRLRRSEVVPEPRSCSEVHPTTAHVLPHAEPQGEPSDAQVDAGAQALFNEMLQDTIGDVGGTFERCRDSARLVLRAAGGVR